MKEKPKKKKVKKVRKPKKTTKKKAEFKINKEKMAVLEASMDMGMLSDEE